MNDKQKAQAGHTCKAESSEVIGAVGRSHSSVEAFVMKVERRASVMQSRID